MKVLSAVFLLPLLEAASSMTVNYLDIKGTCQTHPRLVGHDTSRKQPSPPADGPRLQLQQQQTALRHPKRSAPCVGLECRAAALEGKGTAAAVAYGCQKLHFDVVKTQANSSTASHSAPVQAGR